MFISLYKKYITDVASKTTTIIIMIITNNKTKKCQIMQSDEVSCEYDSINTFACLIVLPNRLTPSLYIVRVLDRQMHCDDVVTGKKVQVYINDEVCPVSLLPQIRHCFSSVN